MLCQVQRPGALEEVALDLVILRSAVGAARRLVGINQDIRRIVDELGNGLFGKVLDSLLSGRREQKSAVSCEESPIMTSAPLSPAAAAAACCVQGSSTTGMRLQTPRPLPQHTPAWALWQPHP